MKQVEAIHLGKGDILFHQGDTNTCAFVIAKGEVVLFQTIDGKRRDCERRGYGAVLGALSVLTGAPRYASVEALTETTVYKISDRHILDDIDNTGPLLRACLDTSISFNARLHSGADNPPGIVSSAITPLRNNQDILDKYKFEIDLQNGLENNEFFMVYQPIVKLGTGQIVGFEALMRWNQPDRGFVRPDVFIKAAEELGIIRHLTDIALRQTCQTLTKLAPLSDPENPVFASINISGRDIARAGFVDGLAFALDAHSVSPSQVKLEVTETAILPDNATVAANLDGIKSLKCGLAIDDFGTGYSNLAHLKSLPLSALKIDRAFAADARSNRISSGIVSMLVQLGDVLGIDIVAEGVETREDVDTLHRLGCKLAQGYHYHRPAAEADLIKLVIAAERARKAIA